MLRAATGNAARLGRALLRAGTGSRQSPRERYPRAWAAVRTLEGSDRRWEVIGLTARSGASYAAHQLERLVTPASSRAALDAGFQLRTAAEVTEALGNMKGVLMKVGQIASYADEGLPEAFRTALASLQQEAPPMSAELAAQVIEEELGGPPRRVFREWDDRPLAAASIGQVHRALSHDGRWLAVKVQYPGVARAIRDDLAGAGWLFSMLGRAFPGMDSDAAVSEIRARILEELDYEVEADNQRMFAAFYSDHPFVHIPGVAGEFSTQRVLATDLARGVRFEDIAAWPADERNKAAEAIFRFVFRSLFHFHAFNGDPHPGNYLFRPGGHVTFVDFGFVRRFTAPEATLLEELVRTLVIDRDASAFRTVMEQGGFLPPASGLSDELVGDYFGHFFAFLLEEGTFTFSPEYASSTVRRLFDPTGPYAQIMKVGNAPPFAILLQRINIGLFAILGHLHAAAPWRSIAEEIWPFTAASPATELGRLEEQWLSEAVTNRQ